jgi:hypothetical protein
MCSWKKKINFYFVKLLCGFLCWTKSQNLGVHKRGGIFSPAKLLLNSLSMGLLRSVQLNIA